MTYADERRSEPHWGGKEGNMPDWTTNAVAVRREHLGKFVKDGRVDFNLLRPMPESLNIVSGSIEWDAIAAATGTPEEELDMSYPYRSNPDMGSMLPFDVENFEDLIKLGEVYLENERKYGARTWYDWCCRNWGTKWNACRSTIREIGDFAVMEFDTAWAAPSKEMFDAAEVWYHAESYDEDYHGIYRWDGLPGRPILFREVTHVEPGGEGEEDWSWDTGEYAPDIQALEEKSASA